MSIPAAASASAIAELVAGARGARLATDEHGHVFEHVDFDFYLLVLGREKRAECYFVPATSWSGTAFSSLTGGHRPSAA